MQGLVNKFQLNISSTYNKHQKNTPYVIRKYDSAGQYICEYKSAKGASIDEVLRLTISMMLQQLEKIQ